MFHNSRPRYASYVSAIFFFIPSGSLEYAGVTFWKCISGQEPLTRNRGRLTEGACQAIITVTFLKPKCTRQSKYEKRRT